MGAWEHGSMAARARGVYSEGPAPFGPFSYAASPWAVARVGWEGAGLVRAAEPAKRAEDKSPGRQPWERIDPGRSAREAGGRK